MTSCHVTFKYVWIRQICTRPDNLPPENRVGIFETNHIHAVGQKGDFADI